MVDKNRLKEWFSNGKKPNQEHFWQWQESYWHKEEKLPQVNIEGLSEALIKKADQALLETHMEDKDAHGLAKKANITYVDDEIERLSQSKISSVEITGDGVTADFTDKSNPKFTIATSVSLSEEQFYKDKDGKYKVGYTWTNQSNGQSVPVDGIKNLNSPKGIDGAVIFGNFYEVVTKEGALGSFLSLTDAPSVKNSQVFLGCVGNNSNNASSAIYTNIQLNAQELSTMFSLSCRHKDSGVDFNMQGSKEEKIGKLDIKVGTDLNNPRSTSHKTTTIGIDKDTTTIQTSMRLTKSTNTLPPLVIPSDSLTTTPLNGAIERGNDGVLYTSYQGFRYALLDSSMATYMPVFRGNGAMVQPIYKYVNTISKGSITIPSGTFSNSGRGKYDIQLTPSYRVDNGTDATVPIDKMASITLSIHFRVKDAVILDWQKRKIADTLVLFEHQVTNIKDYNSSEDVIRQLTKESILNLTSRLIVETLSDSSNSYTQLGFTGFLKKNGDPISYIGNGSLHISDGPKKADGKYAFGTLSKMDSYFETQIEFKYKDANNSEGANGSTGSNLQIKDVVILTLGN